MDVWKLSPASAKPRQQLRCACSASSDFYARRAIVSLSTHTVPPSATDMGRYDFRALRVRQTARALVETRRDPALPPWYKVVTDIPPSEILSRPVQRAPRVRGNAKKPSKMFQPLPIAYPEDKLRSEFFNDHPWELARPRLVVEDSGNDAKGYNWATIVQPGKQLDGERWVLLSIIRKLSH